MNSNLKGFALLAIIVAAAGAYPAFGQAYLAGNTTSTTPTPSTTPVTITVMTDKASYNAGDKITISGSTADYISDQPITVRVINPIGNIVLIAQVDLGTDKTYSDIVVSGGPLWQAAGTYQVDVQFGTPNRAAQTTFQFSGQAAPPPTCLASQVMVNGTCVPLCTGPNTPAGCAVPEFGPIVYIVLAIAIISIITVSAKTGLRIR